MKLLIATSLLFSALSSNDDVVADDIESQVRERVQELVMPFVEQHAVLLQFGFSRAMVPVKKPQLILWTSAPAIDLEERTFVPFHIADLAAGAMPSYSGPTGGCYYPDGDVAYVWLGGAFAVVEAPKTDDTEIALLRLPDVTEDETRCRAKESVRDAPARRTNGARR